MDSPASSLIDPTVEAPKALKATTPSNPKSKKKILLIALIIFGIIILSLMGLLLYFLFKPSKISASPPGSAPPGSAPQGPASPGSPPQGPPSPVSAPPDAPPSSPSPPGPPGIWYMLDSSDIAGPSAAGMCQSLGGSLATSDQLTQAFNAGWQNYCNVGWSANGSGAQTAYLAPSGSHCNGTSNLSGTFVSNGTTGYNIYGSETGTLGYPGVFCAGNIPPNIYQGSTGSAQCSIPDHPEDFACYYT